MSIQSVHAWAGPAVAGDGGQRCRINAARRVGFDFDGIGPLDAVAGFQGGTVGLAIVRWYEGDVAMWSEQDVQGQGGA